MKTLYLSSLFFILAFTASPAPAQAPDPAIDLRGLMSEEQFQAMGLDRLSDEQLQALGRWFMDNRDEAVESARAQAAAEAEAAAAVAVAAAQAEAAAATEAAQAAAAKPEPEKASDEFSARVQGFVGWNGKTLFKLDNGQVWRQRMPGTFNYYDDENQVTFDKNMMGGWKMEHVASGRSVLVEQVR